MNTNSLRNVITGLKLIAKKFKTDLRKMYNIKAETEAPNFEIIQDDKYIYIYIYIYICSPMGVELSGEWIAGRH